MITELFIELIEIIQFETELIHTNSMIIIATIWIT